MMWFAVIIEWFDGVPEIRGNNEEKCLLTWGCLFVDATKQFYKSAGNPNSVGHTAYTINLYSIRGRENCAKLYYFPRFVYLFPFTTKK